MTIAMMRRGAGPSSSRRCRLRNEAARPAINKEFEELHARLDHLTSPAEP
jgi:hypothetical protein